MTLTVLVNAGPWLPVPPAGYGGIENVVATLVPELRALGVRVVLGTVGSSTLPADDRVALYPDGRFADIQRPYNQVSGVALAHQQAVVQALARRPEVDLVHDHVEAVGLAVLGALPPAAVPVLHTLHWDLTKHPELYGTFDGGGRVRVNGVSASQVARAPAALRRHSVGHVHLATPMAVGATSRPAAPKGRHAVVVGRISPLKGQHVAARLAHEHGFPLVLAGPVGPYRSPADLAAAGSAALANPDVQYWASSVAPHVDGSLVRWVGTLSGAALEELVATARAQLFPLQWEEPGGTAMVESLALGTPPVGLARGCLPELVDHGRTGLLTSAEDELPDLLAAASSIDPGECRAEAERRFTPAVMAEAYLELYERVLALSPAPVPVPPWSAAPESPVTLTGEPETV